MHRSAAGSHSSPTDMAIEQAQAGMQCIDEETYSQAAEAGQSSDAQGQPAEVQSEAGQAVSSVEAGSQALFTTKDMQAAVEAGAGQAIVFVYVTLLLLLFLSLLCLLLLSC